MWDVCFEFRRNLQTFRVAPCTQEEADTRTFTLLQCSDQILAGCRKLMIHTVDTNVVFFRCSFFAANKLWRTLTGVAVHELTMALDPAQALALPPLRVLCYYWMWHFLHLRVMAKNLAGKYGMPILKWLQLSGVIFLKAVLNCVLWSYFIVYKFCTQCPVPSMQQNIVIISMMQSLVVLFTVKSLKSYSQWLYYFAIAYRHFRHMTTPKSVQPPSPPDLLPRGSAPGPRWGHSPRTPL